MLWLQDVVPMNGRVDGGFLGILSTSFCFDLRGALRLFCLYFFGRGCVKRIL
jgi:hypothetical protein